MPLLLVSVVCTDLPCVADPRQPGHEYTKANVKFAASVLQSDPIKRLQTFAESNKETQGKFTIGDEKVLISNPLSTADGNRQLTISNSYIMSS
jgi:hypothetical protein